MTKMTLNYYSVCLPAGFPLLQSRTFEGTAWEGGYFIFILMATWITFLNTGQPLVG